MVRMTAAPIHVPVLSSEVIEWLDPRPGQIIVDGTLGGAGTRGSSPNACR